MEIFTEKEAEDFLEDNSFDVVKRVFVKNKKELGSALGVVGFPAVMKIYGKKIIHKNKIKGVETGIGNLQEALSVYDKFKKKSGFEGVIIQETIKGKEFLLGVKKTPEFGQVIVFGSGGTYTEKLKDTSFRVCPVSKNDSKKMISETKIGRSLNFKLINLISKNITRLSNLVKEYENISEMDINPLIVNSKKAVVVDARFVFE